MAEREYNISRHETSKELLDEMCFSDLRGDLDVISFYVLATRGLADVKASHVISVGFL